MRAIIISLLFAVVLSACSAHSVAPVAPLDLPDRVEAVGGWRRIRHPALERSVWFCVNPAENSWEHLGALAGLDPLEYQWWVRDIDGGLVLDAQPRLGERYTIPNRVYIVMGDASVHSPLEFLPYLGTPIAFLLDLPEVPLAPATRPLGALYAFRTQAPFDEGYKVTTITDARRQDLAGVFESPDTFGIVYFGHGNSAGLSASAPVRPDFISIYAIRSRQNHRLGKVVLNSCHSTRMAECIAGPTAQWKAHAAYHFVPFGTLYW